MISWIILYSINGNDYKVIQILNEHKERVTRIIEFRNKKFATYSFDKSIILKSKDNSDYKQEYSIKTNGLMVQ